MLSGNVKYAYTAVVLIAWTWMVPCANPYSHYSSTFLRRGRTLHFSSSRHNRLATTPLSVVESDKEDEQLTEDFPEYLIAKETKKEKGDISVLDDASLLKDLHARQDQIQSGIGRRYKARTQRGFLNVHNDTSSPFSTRNIIGKLAEGQVVTSIGPNEGEWVYHDAFGGGWSISNFGGWQWLIPLED